MTVADQHATTLLETYRRDGRVVISPSKGRALLLTLVSAVIAVLGVLLVLGEVYLVGVLLALFGLVGVWFSVGRVVGPGKDIVLDPHGVTSHDFTVRWDEVEGIGTGEISGQKFTLLRLTTPGRARVMEQADSFHTSGVQATDGHFFLSNQMKYPVDSITLAAGTIWHSVTGRGTQDAQHFAG